MTDLEAISLGNGGNHRNAGEFRLREVLGGLGSAYAGLCDRLPHPHSGDLVPHCWNAKNKANIDLFLYQGFLG
jgi:hypothetical protein